MKLIIMGATKMQAMGRISKQSSSLHNKSQNRLKNWRKYSRADWVQRPRTLLFWLSRLVAVSVCWWVSKKQ